MSKELKATILTMSVHPENDHPIWGELATHITLDQEPGASTLESITFTLKQSFDSVQPGEIKVTITELEKIIAVVKEMLRQYPKEAL